MVTVRFYEEPEAHSKNAREACPSKSGGLTIEYAQSFKEIVAKIKDNALKEKLSIQGMRKLFAKRRIQIKKQIAKLVLNPEVGKPSSASVRELFANGRIQMRYARKNTRELYIPPFRLSYAYLKEEGKIILLDLHHKDKQ